LPGIATDLGNIFIFDTSVLIDDLRTGKHQNRIQSLNGVIRTSAVVLAELWRGATREGERQFLRSFGKNTAVLTPTEANWLESGRVLGQIQSDHGFHGAKLRDLHFDVLIALTARSHGACLITSDRTDFELISKFRPLQLEVW
jgi:predicted nucleic acid-binding protein